MEVNRNKKPCFDRRFLVTYNLIGKTWIFPRKFQFKCKTQEDRVSLHSDRSIVFNRWNLSPVPLSYAWYFINNLKTKCVVSPQVESGKRSSFAGRVSMEVNNWFWKPLLHASFTFNQRQNSYMSLCNLTVNVNNKS